MKYIFICPTEIKIKWYPQYGQVLKMTFFLSVTCIQA